MAPVEDYMEGLPSLAASSAILCKVKLVATTIE
jgi:hypothetical protein